MLKSLLTLLLYCWFWTPLFAQSIHLHARNHSACLQNQVDVIKSSLNPENDSSQQHYLMYDHAYFDHSFGFIAANQESFKPNTFFNIADTEQTLLATTLQDLAKSFEQSKIFGLQDTYSLLMQSLFEVLDFQQHLNQLKPENLKAYCVGEPQHPKLEQHYLTLLDSLRLFHYYLKYENPECLTFSAFKDNGITLDTVAQIIHMLRVDGAPFNLSQLQKDIKRFSHVLPLYKQTLIELPHQYHTYDLQRFQEQLMLDLPALEPSHQNQPKDYMLYTLIIPNYTAFENIKHFAQRLNPNDTLHIFIDASRFSHLQYLLQKHDFSLIVDPCFGND
ncbi:MAG TPA: hypothetical protein PKC21_07620 [Oligoflexia bacterium]|nr:hypothetical protein [Oligoflexia bacterium]HMR25205.1 hypothetical protein [Oligoflexia bacterium]